MGSARTRSGTLRRSPRRSSSVVAALRIFCAADESRRSVWPNSYSSPGTNPGKSPSSSISPSPSARVGSISCARSRDLSEEAPVSFDDPDAAHHRLLEHLGRDRLRGAAEQHGALEGVDRGGRRVLGDDGRPPGLVAERTPADRCSPADAAEEPEGEDGLQPAPGRREVRGVERREGPRLEPDSHRHVLIRQQLVRSRRRPRSAHPSS